MPAQTPIDKPARLETTTPGQPESQEEVFRFSSQTLRLRMREWLAVFVLVLVGVLAIPRFWAMFDSFETGENFRFPYDLSNDYWLVSRWIDEAAANYPILTLGDSVIWGQYAGRNETLAAHLNTQLGREEVGNIGLDGLHPAAMYGLVRYYGKDVRNRQVLIQLNPLWMSSTRHDLQSDEVVRFNHPNLVPQVWPNLPVYDPTFEEAFFSIVERSVNFFSWARHLRLAYFENLDFHSYTTLYPNENPLRFLFQELPAPDENPRSPAIPWQQGGFTVTDFPWIDLETSFQWYSFRKMVNLLQRRGNEVFILVGPFNKYMMTPDSLERYEQLKGEMVAWLEAEGIPHNATAMLPSEEFGDASHPLGSGYEILARALLEDPTFFR